MVVLDAESAEILEGIRGDAMRETRDFQIKSLGDVCSHYRVDGTPLPKKNDA